MQERKVKKILIFSLAYYPNFVGGAEVAIKEITDRISPEEIEFHLLTLRFDSRLPKEEKIGNVFVHRIGFTRSGVSIEDLKKFPLFLNKYWFQGATALFAARLHRRYHFDGIWAMMAHSCGIPAGIFKTIHPEVPYLLTLQEGDPIEHIERVARPAWFFFKRGFTKADKLQAISTFLLAWGRRMGFAREGVVIPNGVDATRFATALPPDEIAATREEIGKQPGDAWLVTTSRLVHKNAVDDVIRALTLLPERVKFLVIGTGTDERLLTALASEQGVVERVHFLGYRESAALPCYLHSCDIFIRPSRSEGMGISFVEAMAAGLPVIATQEGGISDFLFDAKRNPSEPTTGWAVDKNSPEQIAAAVEDILAHPEQVARVTATAKQMAFAKYDWDLVASQMRDLFDRLLSGR